MGGGEVDHLAGSGVPGTPDARVLGQLLAAQNLIAVLPTSQHVADFYAGALASIPGVTSCRVCLDDCSSMGGPRAPEACAACLRERTGRGADDPSPPELRCALTGTEGRAVLPFGTEQRRFGLFVLEVADAARLEPYLPFLHNLGNVVALFLENRLQRTSLLRARDVLERRVAERTEALLRANQQLASEVEERRHAEASVRSLNEELRRALAESEERQRALRESEERFWQSQKLEAIGRLAGGVAHDFNNLLTVILSCSAALRDVLAPGAPGRSEAEEVGAAGQRAADLTRQLLSFSRRQPSLPVSLDLGEVVAGMESLLRRLIGEDVLLEVSRDPALGRVLADRGQLEQVILNLAVNGRDAMPAGGRLRLETANVEVTEEDRAARGAPPGRYVSLAVRDTGAGMTAETRAHLFEPFFTTKAKGKGTGLGLATIYGIVKQAGGVVHVESEPGAGTTFQVLLPRVDRGREPAPPTPAPPSAA